MKIGLDVYSIRDFHLNPFQQIDYAKKLGFEGIQYEGISSLSKNLDFGELKEIKDYADAQGFYSYISCTQVNPILLNLTQSDLVSILKREIQVAAKVGWHEIRSNLGILINRLSSTLPWQRHLESSTQVLHALKPILDYHAVRINLETHSDSTSFELLKIIESVGEKYVGITLDTGNLLTHGEYPVEAVKRLAPYVNLTHAKDALLFFGDKGLIRQGCPPGSGVVEWEKIIPILIAQKPKLNLSIEDHKKLFEINIFDKDWLGWHPDITVYEVGQLVRLAWNIERRRDAGELPDMLAYESVPYTEQAAERLTSGCTYLTGLVKRMGYYG
jgi:sugar phosphate isomerase/epimerase